MDRPRYLAVFGSRVVKYKSKGSTHTVLPAPVQKYTTHSVKFCYRKLYSPHDFANFTSLHFLSANFHSGNFWFVSCYVKEIRITRLKQRHSWVCHNSVNVSGNVIMLVEMVMVMLVVQCSQ
jgi:hypothetical protein